MGFTVFLYTLGVSSIIFLQRSFPKAGKFFLMVTEISDPASAYSIIFPLVAGVNTALAADILVVSLVAEWSNTLIKWCLMEDRPYWWVRETDIYGPNYPVLFQTPLTCETGPGSPSGHVMGASAVVYVLAQKVSTYIMQNCLSFTKNTKKMLVVLLWMTCIVAMVLVSMSRMYVATHFPHQCILGFFLGFALGWLLTNPNSSWATWWRDAERKKLLIVSLLMGVTALVFYWFQKLVGINPQWSVGLAFKWCENPSYVSVSTTPIYSLLRVVGCAAGFAVASPVRRFSGHNKIIGLICAVGIIIVSQYISDHIPTHNAKIYFFCMFLLSAVHPFALIVLIPLIGNLFKKKTD